MIQASILALPLFLFGAAAEDGVVDSTRTWSRSERTVIEVLRLLRNKERPSNAELVARLLPACKASPDFLFEIAKKHRVPSHDGAPEQVLSIYQEDVILETVAQLDRLRVRRFLRAQREVEPFDKKARRASIAFLGAAGTPRDFPEILRLACTGEKVVLESTLGPAVRRAVGTILAEHESGHRELLGANGQLPFGFVRQVALAIGDVGDPRGLEFLVEAMDWHEGLMNEILSQVRKVGFCSEATINDEARSKVRSQLDPSHPMIARTAILATAALDDLDATASLIELLESEDKGMRANAHWALQKITRMRMTLSHDNWSRWYADERRWVGKRKLLAFAMLSSPDPGKIARAIAEVSRHPTVREDFNQALWPVLDTRFPQIRILAIQQLADLGYDSSRIYLEDACSDPVDEVAQAAREALERLGA